MQVEISTDGSVLTPKGPGGWAVLYEAGAKKKLMYGWEEVTTISRMELTAAIMALTYLKAKPTLANLFIDSEYVQKGITQWIHKWKTNKWITMDYITGPNKKLIPKGEKPVKNQDLWKKLDELNQLHKIQWIWVRGHQDHVGNGVCDKYAQIAARSRLNLVHWVDTAFNPISTEQLILPEKPRMTEEEMMRDFQLEGDVL